MNHFQIARDDQGNSTIRSSDGGCLNWRVELVNAITGERATIEEHERREDADAIADWFGRTGAIRAEVTPIESPPLISQAVA